jgi:hypothetical protein
VGSLLVAGLCYDHLQPAFNMVRQQWQHQVLYAKQDQAIALLHHRRYQVLHVDSCLSGPLLVGLCADWTWKNMLHTVPQCSCPCLCTNKQAGCKRTALCCCESDPPLSQLLAIVAVNGAKLAERL